MRVRHLATAAAVAILIFIPPVRAETATPPPVRAETATPPPAEPEPSAGVAVRGGRVTVDPGGSRLVFTGPRGRERTLATFPSRVSPVVRGPDGAFYVGEHAGFPYPEGRARVWLVVPGREPVVAAAGLTAVTGLFWGADGRLYAHQGGRRPRTVRLLQGQPEA